MRRQTWLNLIALAVVALLAMIVWLVPDETAPAEVVKLTTLQPQQIDSITIKNRNGELQLQRGADGWRMLAPYAIDANTMRIEQLLNIANTDSLQQFPAPLDRLAEFGLEHPQASIQLQHYLIQAGNTNPINHQRYLRIDNTIHMIKDRFPHLLMAPASEFVALELIPTGQQLEAISAPDWGISKGENGELELKPTEDGLSMDALNQKITQWQHAQALGVIPLHKAEPIGELKLMLKGQAEPLQYKLIESDGETLLWRPKLGLAYRMPTGTTLMLPPTSAETP